ncbi:glycosyltransferase family 4 protein [Horticoccus luteus]|uniref:Glycosyltransferase family 4 protein n=1 Tax=Horticoccus luteus TaxID=2862869 RepID=A0A8F9XJT4_9BACT|nr:glycosyltransferase family 4 protein [Horticoccus luteus]QYM77501.1 glycosyltransferase family 4 protein [Horticoccus luteus]
MLWFFCDVFARPDDATGRVVTELATALARERTADDGGRMEDDGGRMAERGGRMADESLKASATGEECRAEGYRTGFSVEGERERERLGRVGAVGVRPAREVPGVLVRRVRATTFPKSRAWLLGLNWLTTTFAYTRAAFTHLRQGDVVVVVTSPRLLPWPVVWAARRRGARVIVLVHDVYPDVFAAVGWLRPGWLLRQLDRGFSGGYKMADEIVVLGRDMRDVIARKLAAGGAAGGTITSTIKSKSEMRDGEGAGFAVERGREDDSVTASATEVGRVRLSEGGRGKAGGGGGRIVVIPNWGDVDGLRAVAKEASPVTSRWGLQGKTVVGVGGTLGRTHDGALVIALARALRGDASIRFLIYAGGVGRAEVDAALGGAANVCLAPPCPPAELNDWLAAADVMLVPFRAGMAGISVPSRMYNIFAAGRPLLLTGDLDAEGARLVREHGLGWAVPAGDVASAAEIIRGAAREPDDAAERGGRARALAEQAFTFSRHVAAWRALVGERGGQ